VYIIIWMAGNCNTPWFLWMFILPVATYHFDLIPTNRFNKLDDFPNFHLRV